ncbi:Hypothetical protein A7982_06838 [Minicystis rosea]|nr:Hypothetical protein A7982_06838 [Minicystis rosea]
MDDTGPHLAALLAMIRAKPRWPRPFEVAERWLAPPLADDLRALLLAKAAHQHRFIGIGDLWMDDRDLATLVPGPDEPRRSDVVCIGKTGGGDLYVAHLGEGLSARVGITSHEFGWSEQWVAFSLDQLVADAVMKAREDGETLEGFPD